ncbi:MAG: LacI family DNA-binding transcriptional regulator [Lachnospiraceae bacterium]|nr:LacI family DNA-binding transcriptional regulator [Lachnospiraceae bacterium]
MSKDRVTIKDIAKTAGVSVGTVSKFLNGGSGIKESNRARIQKAIEDMNYTANSVARMLAHNPICLGVILPSDFGTYFDSLLDGIKARVDSLSDHKVTAIYGRYVDYNDSEKIEEILSAFFSRKVDGIIMAPSVSTDNSAILKRLKTSNIPIVSIISKITDLTCVGHVMVDTFLSGEKAADMAELVLNKGETAAVFTGSLSIPEHREKVESFLLHCARNGVRVSETIEAHEDLEAAYNSACRLMKDERNVRFLYVTTANSLSICKAIEDMGRIGEVKMMVTDVLPGMKEYAEKGVIVAALDQHMHRQGELAVDILYSYLTDSQIGTVTESTDRSVVPGLLLRTGI